MTTSIPSTSHRLAESPGQVIALILAAMCLLASPAAAADYTITPSSGDYLNLANVGLQAGDHIYLQAGTYPQLTLLNVTQGTSANPIIITNTGGKVILSGGWGLRMSNCKNFVLQGTPGTGYDYGIQITQSGSSSNMGLSLNGGCTDFTICGLEIGPNIGFAGIFAKSDDLTRDEFVMKNIKIYGNYIHNTGGEGMYIGNTEPMATTNYHEVQNIEIYENRLENTGWDGIQLARATLNPSVHDNVIIGTGKNTDDNWQGQGIVLGSGFCGSCYNNWVQDARTGILCYPWKAVKIYNNVVVDLLEHGIYIGDDHDIVAGYPVYLMNNTIVSPTLDGIQFRSLVTSGNLSYNNIVAEAGGVAFRRVYPGVQVTESNNLYVATVEEAGFTNAAADNYTLASDSDAVNAGANVSSYGVTDDFLGTTRPQGSAYDIGAYEYASGGGQTNNAPTVSAGSDHQITLPTSQVSLDGTVSDDGLPNPPATVTVTWTKQSGPGTVTFGSTSVVDTTATFSASGTYVLRLTASDSSLQSYDECTVTVSPQQQQGGGAWQIITPTGWGQATGSGYCPATGAFDEQPTWDDDADMPIGDAASPHAGTATSYASRYFYIDFGPDYDDIRIVATWTRWRPSTSGTFAGFPAAWWDDDKDTTNDGTTESTLNWTKSTVPDSGSQQWVRDVDASGSPITPQGRYLIVSTGASPTDRANEFAVVGYFAGANAAPTASAGSDQTANIASAASLDGTVSDDGLPNPPAAVTVTWTKQSGPGTVTFGSASAVDTTATFSASGTYVLRLTADDGNLTAYDEVTVVANAAPTVNAGNDASITLPTDQVSLDATVTDDGLPNPPAAVTVTWTKQSGPGTVTFGSASAVDTTATFSAAGTYVLRLTASDGDLQAYDEVTITVSSSGPTPITVNGFSFETPTQTDGNFTDKTATGWTYDGNQSTNAWGAKNPTTSEMTQSSGVLSSPGDATQYCYMNSGSLYQVLGEGLTANKTYTLTVGVARRLETGRSDANYYIRLYAGATLLAETTGSTSTQTSGVCTDKTVTYTAGATPPSGSLKIMLGTPDAQASRRLGWDNVRLTKQ